MLRCVFFLVSYLENFFLVNNIRKWVISNILIDLVEDGVVFLVMNVDGRFFL